MQHCLIIQFNFQHNCLLEKHGFKVLHICIVQERGEITGITNILINILIILFHGYVFKNIPLFLRP